LRNDALLLLVQADLYAFIDVQSEANSRSGRPLRILSFNG